MTIENNISTSTNFLVNFTTSQTNNVTAVTKFIPSPEIRLAVDIIFQFDSVVRISSLIIHLFYFYLIYRIKEWRNVGLWYVHHSNIIGFIFNLHYIVYWDYTFPYFLSPTGVIIWCTISEQIWALCKNARTYSIALIAIYRWIAVFRINDFKRLNKSKLNIMIPIILMYVVALAILLGTRYGFGTKYGLLFCFDGFSPIRMDSINNFIVNAIVGLLFPTLAAVVIYYLITRKLKQSKKNTASSHTANTNTNTLRHESLANSIAVTQTGPSTVSSALTKKEKRDQHSLLAMQFLVMDLCQIVSCACVIGLGMRYMFPNLNEYYNVPRFLLRTVNLIFQLCIPLASIYFNRESMALIYTWKKSFMDIFYKTSKNALARVK